MFLYVFVCWSETFATLDGPSQDKVKTAVTVCHHVRRCNSAAVGAIMCVCCSSSTHTGMVKYKDEKCEVCLSRCGVSQGGQTELVVLL